MPGCVLPVREHRQKTGFRAVQICGFLQSAAATSGKCTGKRSYLSFSELANFLSSLYHSPLHLACISGYVDVVAALIRMAPHPCLLNIQNDVAQTPLHLAALTAQPAIIRMLLLAGAEVSFQKKEID